MAMRPTNNVSAHFSRDSPSQGPQQQSSRLYASPSASSPMPTVPSPARFDPSTYTAAGASGMGSPRVGRLPEGGDRLPSTFSATSQRRGDVSNPSPRRGVGSYLQPDQQRGPYDPPASMSVDRSGAQQRQDSGLFYGAGGAAGAVVGPDDDRGAAWLTTSSGATGPRWRDVEVGGRRPVHDGATSTPHSARRHYSRYDEDHHSVEDDDSSPMELSAVGYDDAIGGRGGRGSGSARRGTVSGESEGRGGQPRPHREVMAAPAGAGGGSAKRGGSLDNLGNDQLHHRCLMLASCLEHTTSERDALSEMINNLTSYRDALLQDVFDLRGDKQDLTEKVQSIERDLAAVQEELHRSVERADGLSAAKHLVEAAHEKSATALEAMQQENRQLLSEREHLSQTVTLQQTKQSEAEAQLAQLAAKLEHAQLDAARAQQELLESKVIEGQMDKMVMQREEAFEHEHTQLEACMRDKQQLQQALEDATARENASHRTLDGLSRSNEELRSEIKRLATRHEKDTSELATLRAEVSALREKESTWLTHRETLEVQRGSAQGSSEQLVLRCQELKEHAASLEQKLEALLAANSKLQTSEAELKTKLAYTQEKTDALQQANDSERERVADRDTRLQATEAQLERATADATALRNANETMSAASEQLAQQLAAAAAALSQTENDLAEHRALRQADAAAHAATVVQLQSDRAFAELQATEMRSCTQVLHDLHSHVLQTSAFAAAQQREAKLRVEGLQDEAQAAKSALEAAAADKQALVHELQQGREARLQLHHRVEQLETTVDQVNELLAATRQDRDLLVTEIRRSQSLWLTMSEEQTHMRNQLRHPTTGEHSANNAPAAGSGSGNRSSSNHHVAAATTSSPCNTGMGGGSGTASTAHGFLQHTTHQQPATIGYGGSASPRQPQQQQDQ